MAIAFLNNITFSGGAQAEKLRLENLPSNPASGNEGQLYFNTATDKVLVYANGAWANLDGANDFLTGLSFDTGDGVLTATVSNQSDVTVDLDGRYALSGSIPGTIVQSVTAQTYLNNSGTAADVILNHDNTSRTDTTSTSSPGSGGTIDVVNTVTTNATGHVTAVDIQTVTFPTNTNTTYTLPTTNGANPDIVLTGNDSSTDIVNMNGNSTTVKVTGSGANTLTFDLEDDVTITTSLTINGTAGDALDIPSGKGTSALTIGTDPSDTLTTKSYVDGLVSGGLTFKGTFRADTGAILSGGNSGSFLYNCPGGAGTRVAVTQGDYYVVATAGGSFYCSGVTLDIGDAIIAVDDAAADSSDAADWSTISQGVTVNSFTNANGTYISAGTVNTNATGAVTVGTIDLSAVDGTSDTSTKFLSKDNTWDVPSYTTNTDAKYALTAAAKSGSNVPLTLTGSDGGATTTVNLTEGSNITLTRNSSGQITIASTDTGALGDRVALTGGSQAGGLTTFTYDVTNSFTGANAIDVKCEVISAAGETVYAGVTRSGDNLSVEFVGSISDSAYEVLLTYVG